MSYKEKLNSILVKEPDTLTVDELIFLLSKVGYLSDEERKKFSPVLKRKNLTPEAIERYRERRMQVLLDLYFPAKDDI
jgi:hypothetical protein